MSKEGDGQLDRDLDVAVSGGEILPILDDPRDHRHRGGNGIAIAVAGLGPSALRAFRRAATRSIYRCGAAQREPACIDFWQVPQLVAGRAKRRGRDDRCKWWR